MSRIFPTAQHALCWITECTLATVESLELKTRPPQGELSRQKEIADTGIANLKDHGFGATAARALRCGRVADQLAILEAKS